MTATLDEHGANQHGWGSFFHGPGEENPSRPIGFRVCDRRFPFLWSGPGQRGGRWNREGEAPIHYLASSPLAAWAEWLRHQEIEETEDLQGVAAAEQAHDARLACVQRFRQRGAIGLRAPTAALRNTSLPPCWRCREGEEVVEALPESAEVLVLWCDASVLAGWPCVRAGAPGAETLPYVRLSGRLAGSGAIDPEPAE